MRSFNDTDGDGIGDLNWANPEVRQALYNAAQFWVDKGIGGFRLDAVTYIKKPDFADGKPDAGDGLAAIHPITANTEGILDDLHEFKDSVLAGTDLFTVGEANGVSAEELPQWVGSGGVFDMVFEFSHVLVDLENEADWSSSRPWALADLKKILRAAHSELTEGNFVELLEDHEQIFGYIRKDADAEAIILTNFSEEEAAYDPALVEGAELLLSSAGTASQPGVLAPLECVIYER